MCQWVDGDGKFFCASSNFRMFTKVTPFLALCKCYVLSLLFAQLQLHMEKLTS